jgi:thiamine-phosphate pyrophosphorylase
MYGLYVITDESLSGLSHQEVTRLACEGGADVIQLRDKTMDDERLTMTARDIRRITSLHGVLFFVNDRLDIALESGADGVHLGQGDMRLTDALKMKGELLIGISAGTPEQAVAAERDGADYIGFGPVFTTSSKHDARDAVGTGLLKKVREAVRIPIVAIGGITKENAEDVMRSGADGIAVISAVVFQSDITKAAEELKNMISAVVRA